MLISDEIKKVIGRNYERYNIMNEGETYYIDALKPFDYECGRNCNADECDMTCEEGINLVQVSFAEINNNICYTITYKYAGLEHNEKIQKFIEAGIESVKEYILSTNMRKIIKLSNHIGAKLNLKACEDEKLTKSIKEVSNVLTEEEILNAMNEFMNGKIMFNYDSGESEYYFYIENNKVMYFTPSSIEGILTNEKIKENGKQYPTDNVFSLINDIFLGYVSSFENK